MGELIYVLGRDGEHFSAGAENYAVAHCKSAVRGGYWPHWYSFARRRETQQTDYATIHRLAWPGHEFRSEYALFYRHRLAHPVVRRLRDSPGPHVIHSFGVWGVAGVLAAEKLRRAGVEVKHVNTCYELMGPHTESKLDNGVLSGDPWRHARQRLIYEWVKRSTIPMEKDSYLNSDAVIVNYERLRELIHSDYDASIKVVNLPYAAATAFDPIDSTSELPTPVAELAAADGPLIFASSRHMPRKGVDVLIRALARVRDEGHAFRAALVGTGRLLEDHRALVRELGLADRVTLPGRVPTVGAYLRHSDIFALPSLAEGSGSMSVLEALQYGVPVISSAVDGMLEDLSDHADSILVETGSAEDLARGLAELIADPALRERLGDAGRQVYNRRFSADAATAALTDFYAGLGLEPGRAS
jgi:glycosyltransferase involved in cell wall biosynthesis